LNRRVNLILSQKPSRGSMRGNSLGINVEIEWESGNWTVFPWGPWPPEASTYSWARHRDVICQTRTPASATARGTGNRSKRMFSLTSPL